MVVNIYGSCRRTGVGLQQPHGIVHNFCNSNHKGYNYLLWPLHIPALICKKNDNFQNKDNYFKNCKGMIDVSSSSF